MKFLCVVLLCAYVAAAPVEETSTTQFDEQLTEEPTELASESGEEEISGSGTEAGSGLEEDGQEDLQPEPSVEEDQGQKGQGHGKHRGGHGPKCNKQKCNCWRTCGPHKGHHEHPPPPPDCPPCDCEKIEKSMKIINLARKTCTGKEVPPFPAEDFFNGQDTTEEEQKQMEDLWKKKCTQAILFQHIMDEINHDQEPRLPEQYKDWMNWFPKMVEMVKKMNEKMNE